MDVYKYTLVIYILVVTVKQGESSLLTDSCATTEEPDICVSKFNEDPRSAQVANVTELIRLGMEISVGMANKSCDAAETRKTWVTDDKGKSNMDLCVAAYKDVTQTIVVEGMQMLDSHNYIGASHCIRSLGDAALACNETGDFQMAFRNTDNFHFSNDLLSIIKPLLPLDPPKA